MDAGVILFILLISFLAGFTTFIGIGIALLFKDYVEHHDKLIVTGIGFSAGIMLAISFLELMPESIRVSGKIAGLSAMVAGFISLLIIHMVVPHTHIFHEKGKKGKLIILAFMVMIGMILHDFPEGFSMANSYLFSMSLGAIVIISIALHNIPEGFAIAIPLLLTGKKQFLYRMTLLSTLASPMGALIGIAAVSVLPVLNPFFLAFGAGAMIFVSIDELFPLAMSYHKPAFFAVGVGIAFISYFGMNVFL